jgi:hypothetical protein
MIPIGEYTYTNAKGEKRHVTRTFDNGDVIFNEGDQSLKCSGVEWEKWCGAKCQSEFDAHFVPVGYITMEVAKIVHTPDPQTTSEFNKDAKWEKSQQIKGISKKS